MSWLQAYFLIVQFQLNVAFLSLFQDKQLLAQHLEAIEADMLDREAAFTQLQLQRDSLQNALKHSNGLSNAAPVQAAVLNGAGDAKQNGGDSLSMELEVRRLQNDTKRKAAQIAVLEHEQSELMKRWVLSAYALALRLSRKCGKYSNRFHVFNPDSGQIHIHGTCQTSYKF